jgi:hypothetical protein
MDDNRKLHIRKKVSLLLKDEKISVIDVLDILLFNYLDVLFSHDARPEELEGFFKHAYEQYKTMYEEKKKDPGGYYE